MIRLLILLLIVGCSSTPEEIKKREEMQERRYKLAEKYLDTPFIHRSVFRPVEGSLWGIGASQSKNDNTLLTSPEETTAPILKYNFVGSTSENTQWIWHVFLPQINYIFSDGETHKLLGSTGITHLVYSTATGSSIGAFADLNYRFIASKKNAFSLQVRKTTTVNKGFFRYMYQFKNRLVGILGTSVGKGEYYVDCNYNCPTSFFSFNKGKEVETYSREVFVSLRQRISRNKEVSVKFSKSRLDHYEDETETVSFDFDIYR